MEMILLRIYLLSGLVIHKAVWEIMKRQEHRPLGKTSQPLKTRLASGAKVAVLAVIVVQIILARELFPISHAPTTIRAAGLLLYTLGLVMAVTARIQLGRNWSDIEKSYVKQDHALVAHGLYRVVRHPIYTGDLLLLLGLELALNSWAVIGAVAVAVYVRQQAIREERNLIERIPGYDQYCRRTARFVPFLPV
ncbi:MAG TPA: isoprenylcysteine carboxylmethyltransferase family protein [Terriglobia bacterium]|nr:isoprenylcysteine carboxylmethyltransferase family protein [Terriglobia bacterium]